MEAARQKRLASVVFGRGESRARGLASIGGSARKQAAAAADVSSGCQIPPIAFNASGIPQNNASNPHRTGWTALEGGSSCAARWALAGARETKLAFARASE